MRLKTTFAELQPGDRFSRMMKQWEVLGVGDRLPGYTNRPVHVRRTDTGEEKTFNIQDHSEVWATRPEEKTA